MPLTHFPYGITVGTTTGNPAKMFSVVGSASVSGTFRSSGILSASAAGKQTSLTKLAVSGTTVLSGVLTASAAGKQSTLTKLAVTGTAVLSGAVTATASGKQTSLTKLAVSGTTVLSGAVTATGSGKTLRLLDLRVSSAANAITGKRYIATAGTATTNKFHIATTKALTSSRIFITPQVNLSGNSGNNVKASIATIASGLGFSVRLSYGVTPTGCTGMVNWMIVNT